MRLLPLAVLALAACAPALQRPVATDTPTPARATAPDQSCVAALDSLQTVFRRDYSGYADKVPGREAELAALTDSVRAIAGTSEHHSVCIAQALQPWTRFFRDPHVMVWQAGPPPPPGTTPSQAAAPGGIPPDDPDRPSLTFRDGGTAVFRLPSMHWSYKPAVDSLVAANRARLLATPYLVVDVRGNGGGATSTFGSLIPLLYTGPIHQYGADIWSSEGNRAMLREWIANPTFPEGDRVRARAALARMEASPNQFVSYAPDGHLRRDTVHPLPRRAAVMMDGKCASSCENFVQVALQSAKVTVFGPTNTRGVGDYGNVRAVKLPGWRELRVPTSRSRRLLAEGPLDGVGIAPQVRIPETETDAIAFALRHLRSRPEAKL